MESFGFWRRLRAYASPPPPDHPCARALLEAAGRGDATAVQELVARGTPPDQVRTSRRETALWLAAADGHKAAVEALLAVGADPGAEDSAGASPLTQAASAGRADIVRLMAKARPDAFRSPSAALGLRRAALNGHWRAVGALLEGGVPPDARPRGLPPALFAAAVSDARCVAELLAAGADHGARDADRRTPLHWAVRANQEEATRLLLVCGADRSARDKDGRVPADEACTDAGRQLLRPLDQQEPRGKSCALS